MVHDARRAAAEERAGIGTDYRFDLLIYDSAKTQISVATKAVIDPVTKALSVHGNLPAAIMFTVKGQDGDMVGSPVEIRSGSVIMRSIRITWSRD